MPAVDLHADHTLLLALPAFAPAIVVVGVVIWVAMRDRRRAPDADDMTPGDGSASADEDGAP